MTVHACARTTPSLRRGRPAEHCLQTLLTEAQEQIVVAASKTLWLSLGDLLIVT